jgi:type IV secretory pathway VirB2 component (pilin)
MHMTIRFIPSKLMVFLCAVAVLFMPEHAYAVNPIAHTLCVAATWFTAGSVGYGLMALSTIIIGIAAMMNKITWGMAFFGVLDICLICSAAWFVTEFGGSACTP